MFINIFIMWPSNIFGLTKVFNRKFAYKIIMEKKINQILYQQN